MGNPTPVPTETEGRMGSRRRLMGIMVATAVVLIPAWLGVAGIFSVTARRRVEADYMTACVEFVWLENALRLIEGGQREEGVARLRERADWLRTKIDGMAPACSPIVRLKGGRMLNLPDTGSLPMESSPDVIPIPGPRPTS